jgi:hypothetical protein
MAVVPSSKKERVPFSSAPRKRLKRFPIIIGLILFLYLSSLSSLYYNYDQTERNVPLDSAHQTISTFTGQEVLQQEQPTMARIPPSWCALLFFGLPRAYKEMVLPSIVQNILIPNARHECDIYVHYYHQRAETAGRYNPGGAIDPDDIFLLKQAAIDVAKHHGYGGRLPHVAFVNDTELSFGKKRGTSLDKYQNTTDKKGRPLYFPWKDKGWQTSSLTNMVKGWHSIDSVFQLMETTSAQQLHNFSYSRVGIFRSDVMFLTPIDIAALDRDRMDVHNQHVVLAPFGKHPVNDRMIYGPLLGVKVWATQRFELIEKRVQLHKDPGYEMHSERFLNASLLPAIQKLGVSINTNPDICFLRTRADKSVLLRDCSGTVSGKTRDLGDAAAVTSLVEAIVGTNCTKTKPKALVCDFGAPQVIPSSESESESSSE